VFTSDNDLGLQSENLSVHWSANDGRDVIVGRNEVAGNDHVEARFIPTLGDFLTSAVDLAPPQGLACSFIRAFASRSSRPRCVLTISASRSSSAFCSTSVTYLRTASRMIRERLVPGGRPLRARRSTRSRISSSIVTAIVFILQSLSCAPPQRRAVAFPHAAHTESLPHPEENRRGRDGGGIPRPRREARPRRRGQGAALRAVRRRRGTRAPAARGAIGGSAEP